MLMTTMPTEEQLEYFRPHVQNQAAKVVKWFGDWVSFDDTVQELWLWLLSNPKRFEPLLLAEEDPNTLKEDLTTERKFLCRNLLRAGNRWAQREKAKQVGYKVRDLTWYSESLIATLLGVKFGGKQFEPSSLEDQRRARKPLNEGLGLEAMLCDVDVALEKLSAEHQMLVIRAYGLDEPVQSIADDFGVTRQAMDKKLARVLGKMVNHLGGESPF